MSPRAGTSGVEAGAPGKLLLAEAPPWASSSPWPPAEMPPPQGTSPACPTPALTPKAFKGNNGKDTQRSTPGTQNRRREEERGVLYTFATRNVQHSKEGRAAPPARQLPVPGHPQHHHQTPRWDQELGRVGWEEHSSSHCRTPELGFGRLGCCREERGDASFLVNLRGSESHSRRFDRGGGDASPHGG